MYGQILDKTYGESYVRLSIIMIHQATLNLKRILSLCQNQWETFHLWARPVIYPYRLGCY